MAAHLAHPGLFITLEGTEGCGKSTHIRLLANRLRELGYSPVTLREPGELPSARRFDTPSNTAIATTR